MRTRWVFIAVLASILFLSGCKSRGTKFILAQRVNGVGIALYTQGNVDEALERFKKAIEYTPDFAFVRNNAGVAYYHLSQLDLAIAEFRRAIEIDGVDLRDLQRNSFLDHVAIVTQEPFLFDASILENIRYGRPEASMEDVRAAAAAARADEFIDQLPAGYDTPVGEFGLQLSGGQRQRITIARAILRDPAILVFDEATSSLDAKTERAVQSAIDALRGERTIFVVAHRLSTIRHADRIVVLDEGRIADIGDHATLMSRPGIYRELVGVQEAAQTSA